MCASWTETKIEERSDDESENRAARKGCAPPPPGGGQLPGQRCRLPNTEIHADGQRRKRIGVAAVGEVDARQWSRRPRRDHRVTRQLHCTVRGFRRGNNVNNTNLSPLYVNANNAPSNANTNIAFGNCKAKRLAVSPR